MHKDGNISMNLLAEIPKHYQWDREYVDYFPPNQNKGIQGMTLNYIQL